MTNNAVENLFFIQKYNARWKHLRTCLLKNIMTTFVCRHNYILKEILCTYVCLWGIQNITERKHFKMLTKPFPYV